MRKLYAILVAMLISTVAMTSSAQLRVAHRKQKAPVKTHLTAQPVDTFMRRVADPVIEHPSVFDSIQSTIEPIPGHISAETCPPDDTVAVEIPVPAPEPVAVSKSKPAPVPKPAPRPAASAVRPIVLPTDLEAISILGTPEISPDVMAAFVASRNPDFDPAIARAFHEVGRRYGIRGDIALCQSIIETGWFRFADGTAVKPEQHNYCGLGVTTRGVTGHSFESIEKGVTAQIQHLYAYATSKPLPSGEKLIDPRFKLVSRGIAPTWRDLNRRWAMNDRYSQSIMNLFQQLISFHNSQCDQNQNFRE